MNEHTQGACVRNISMNAHALNSGFVIMWRDACSASLKVTITNRFGMCSFFPDMNKISSGYATHCLDVILNNLFIKLKLSGQEEEESNEGINLLYLRIHHRIYDRSTRSIPLLCENMVKIYDNFLVAYLCTFVVSSLMNCVSGLKESSKGDAVFTFRRGEYGMSEQ